MTRLFVNIGRNLGVRPQDIVGAIAGTAILVTAPPVWLNIAVTLPRCCESERPNACRFCSKPPQASTVAFDRNTVANPKAVPTLPKNTGITICVTLRNVLYKPMASAIRPAGASTYSSDISMG